MKSETIIFKLEPEERVLIDEQVKKENFGSVSEFIRKTIMDRCRSWGKQKNT